MGNGLRGKENSKEYTQWQQVEGTAATLTNLALDLIEGGHSWDLLDGREFHWWSGNSKWKIPDMNQ